MVMKIEADVTVLWKELHVTASLLTNIKSNINDTVHNVTQNGLNFERSTKVKWGVHMRSSYR
jgi:hypothetical protein